jgi:hypothetical protein
MPMRLDLRYAAIVLLALTSLAAPAVQWQSTRSMNLEDTGSLALDGWEQRLEPVRRNLPLKQGVIGYVADWDVPGIEYSPGDQEAEFLLSQYSLAPLVLVRGAQAEWNVGVFSPQAFQAWQAANQDRFEIISLRRNVYLLHRLDDQ